MKGHAILYICKPFSFLNRSYMNESPTPGAERCFHLVPRAALRRTSRLFSGLALGTAEVQPPRRDIELRAGVKLRINERPLGTSSR